jgi:hypothetical protein
MTSYTVRDWVTVGLFGALWGAIELTLGSALHTAFPPLTNTFLTGVVMSGIGVSIALTGKLFVPKGGSVLLIGVVTALLKLLGIDGVKIGPMIAIIVQSTLIEVALLILPASHWAFVIAGALAVSWNLPHMLIMPQILLGKSASEVYNKVVQQGSQWLGLDPSVAFLILGVLLSLQLLIGAVGGWGAWGLGSAVEYRLGRHPTNTSEDND